MSRRAAAGRLAVDEWNTGITMHGMTQAEFLSGISGFLGTYYLLLGLMNAVAAFYLWQSAGHGHDATPTADVHAPRGRGAGLALVWLVLAMVYVVMSPLAYSGDPTVMSYVSVPQGIQRLVNAWTGPVTYGVGSLAVLVFMFVCRRFFTRPVVAWVMLNAALALMGLSMTNPSFAGIVTKPDNVPIVAMVFLLGFFTWLSAYRSVENDDRIARGEPPLEALDNEKVLVWPDLVYIELICMVALTALLIFWAIGLQAPLEEPASSVKTPNPSKAPWYFLGLQEMLVYFDPWYAGVVAPSVIVAGLMAIPYIDFNKKGNGYYTIKERQFAYVMFQFGFLSLWVTLIVLGTFLRGPNWNFFGPYEEWDAHKVLALNNVDLSQYFWVYVMNTGRPKAPPGSGAGTEFLFILWRELPGIVLVLLYFVVLPPLMAMTVFRNFFVRMGLIRFMVMANLFLLMMTFPVKMLLRWSPLNLKYIISIPEYFLNF
ncbi:MAG: hypothetical protein KDA41_20040 [Planctomycetales bacterium]|nr:hypothetical protein [Planctomycetales bacterium]